MPGLSFAIVATIGIGVGVALGIWVQQQRAEAKPPPRGWKGDKITPVMLGPRNKAPERAGRRMVMTQAVLLAATMARKDGNVTEEEKAAIQAFILAQVTGADQDFATSVMRDGLTATVSSAVSDAAIETVRAVGSEEQKQLVIALLVAVAKADGKIHPQEVSFMNEVGGRLGIDEATVKDLLGA